jgi:C4-dicarboxylate-specific signal transduction histidine kinase
VQSIVEATRAASEVFDNLRALFGRAELVKDRVDVNALVTEVLRMLDADFRSRRIATRAELAPELPAVLAHRGQLQEVLVNLVHNAIEAMDTVDDRRILRLGTMRNGAGTIAVTVEDTGPGLSPEQARDVFDAFVTTKPHGMGLGLAICRMIVERHGGRLSTSAVSPRGAIFRVDLPQVDGPH